MIEIYGIDDTKVLEVAITESCEHVEELMNEDYVQLSWESASSDEIPAGTYINYDGFTYTLLKPYKPTQEDEITYLYKPQFHSEIILWKMMPFFLYTETESSYVKEPDWELTDNPANFMAYIVKALNMELGITDEESQWSYAVASGLASSAYVSFNNTDIYSGLNAIANAFETEWYADKKKRVIYLGKAIHGEDSPITLEVGESVSIPTVKSNNDDYFTRYFAFGSTKNIDQSAGTGAVNSIVNRRLTLDTERYPGGYIDIKRHYEKDGVTVEDSTAIAGSVFVSDLKAKEVFATNVYFDDIYPRATEGDGTNGLYISDVRARAMFRVDGDGNKIVLGSASDGTEVYEQYTIYFFKIANLFDDNIKSLILPNTKLSGSFESGSLQGWEFELTYYDEDKTLENTNGETFEVEKGDFEIVFKEENGLIIPTTPDSGLIPKDGDLVALFNIRMPDSYVANARRELETRIKEYIDEKNEDTNNYSFDSNPIYFMKNTPNLSIGQAVEYINGSYSLTTRIIKLVTKLDYPCKCNITIGNSKIKGNVAKLSEDVVSANKNIDALAAYNEMTTTIQGNYTKTQQLIIERFNQWADVFEVVDIGTAENPKKAIHAKLGIFTDDFLSAKGADDTTGGSGIDLEQMWVALASEADNNSKIINDSHLPSTIVRKTDLEWINANNR